MTMGSHQTTIGKSQVHLTPRRYAGFDPHENEFEGVELAPLHPQDEVRRTTIDLGRAEYLKGLGWNWAAVGRQLAVECGRKIAYRGESVRAAVLYATPKALARSP